MTSKTSQSLSTQMEAVVKAASLQHLSISDVVAKATSLQHLNVTDMVAKAASLQHLNVSDMVAQAATLQHLNVSDMVARAASLQHLNVSDMVAQAASLQHLNVSDMVAQVASLQRLNVSDMVAQAASLQHLSVSDMVAQVESLQHHGIFNSVIDVASLKRFDTLNSLYTEQELTEFSEALSEVGNSLQRDTTSNMDETKGVQRVPVFLLLFLKYIFNYIVMPLVVATYLQPLLTDFLKESDEPLRVQKNTIKKLPQKNGIETTPANRFISGNGVRLRISASTKVEIITHLEFGQLVNVLEKDRSWVKVAVPQKNGEPLEGWVLNEYTERFK
ncbi:TPA: SH3 domain-containing protein [Vibrio parahaemolyticus]|uniref:SH3 domain-containing protein n=1 Tax=Vibrio parahaemolyticus TaxID=670 RepID=UPI002119A167|nr:SH3 domain-containing protein [Vibrio parahaemolyticus]